MNESTPSPGVLGWPKVCEGGMSDREYLDTLRQRARGIVNDMQRLLSGHELDNEDGKFAPHVAKERLQRVAALAEKLSDLAAAA